MSIIFRLFGYSRYIVSSESLGNYESFEILIMIASSLKTARMIPQKDSLHTFPNFTLYLVVSLHALSFFLLTEDLRCGRRGIDVLVGGEEIDVMYLQSSPLLARKVVAQPPDSDNVSITSSNFSPSRSIPSRLALLRYYDNELEKQQIFQYFNNF